MGSARSLGSSFSFISQAQTKKFGRTTTLHQFLKKAVKEIENLWGEVLRFPAMQDISPLSLDRLKELVEHGSNRGQESSGANQVRHRLVCLAVEIHYRARKVVVPFCVCLRQTSTEVPPSVHEHAASHGSWNVLRRGRQTILWYGIVMVLFRTEEDH